MRDDALVTVEPLTDTLRALDLIGVFANAVLGGVMARSARLDPVGFATLAIISGLGGGLIRDTLLQRGTPVALVDYAYVLTALAGAAVAFLIPIQGRIWDRAWPLIDALALGCWAAAGATKTLDFGLGWLPAVLLGTVTAVGGGFVRDIILRRIPSILGGNTLYATCALTSSGLMVVLYRNGHPNIGSVAATLLGAALVLLARWQHWVLPQNDDWSAIAAARTGYYRGARYVRERAPHRQHRDVSAQRDADSALPAEDDRLRPDTREPDRRGGDQTGRSEKEGTK